MSLAKLITLASLLFALPAAAVDNILLVILDDVGVDKINVYPNSTNIHTPTIDAQAAAGIRFDRFAAEPVCSPTRAAILTGRSPFRHGVGFAINISNPAAVAGKGLNPSEPTIAKTLRAAGYRTMAVGKWHIGGAGTTTNVHPLQTGFQTFQGMLGNLQQTWTGSPASTSYTSYEWCVDGLCSTQTTYNTRKITDTAISLIASTSQPWFMWLAYNAPHDPDHCPPDLTPDVTPSFDATCGGAVDHPTLAEAALEGVDTELGRIVTAITASPGWATTTMIIVGDNGTDSDAIDNPPYTTTHAKNTAYQQGVRTPLIVRGHAVAVSEVGTVGTQSIHTPDLSATILDIAGLAPDATAYPGSTVTDGISIKPYLAESSTASIRTNTFSQRFTPNGLPYIPGAGAALVRRAEHSHFALVRQITGDEFFDFTGDLHEATPLNPASLTAEQQTSFDRLQDMPDDEGPTPIYNGRSLVP